MRIPIEDVAAGRVDFGGVEKPGGRRLPPLHPGEVLREEFLAPLGMSAYALAKALHVPRQPHHGDPGGQTGGQRRHGAAPGQFLRDHGRFWIRLQGAHDLELARFEQGAAIAAEVRERAPAA